MFKHSSFFILICFALILQLAVVPALSSYLAAINLNLIFLVSLIFFVDTYKRFIYWPLLSAFFLDLYSFSFFGSNLVSFLLIYLLVDLFMRRFLTNRSLYSFLFLILLMNIVFFLLFIFFNYLNYFFTESVNIFINFNFLKFVWRQIAVDLFFSFSLFLTINLIVRGFKPVFIK